MTGLKLQLAAAAPVVVGVTAGGKHLYGAAAPVVEPHITETVCQRNDGDGKHDWEPRTPRHLQCRWCHAVCDVTPVPPCDICSTQAVCEKRGQCIARTPFLAAPVVEPPKGLIAGEDGMSARQRTEQNDCMRVCPVKDIPCGTPGECSDRETGCKMLINLPTMTAAVREPPAQDARVPDNDLVICPNCIHQFRAIPVNVQKELAAAMRVVEIANKSWFSQTKEFIDDRAALAAMGDA